MKLSTGKVAFKIEFDNGNIETIYFNPCDLDLAIRMKDFEKLVDDRINELGSAELNASGESESGDLEVIEKVRTARNIMCEEIDRAFNGDISSKVFKYCSPFAIVGGNYFILQFIEGITPEIEEYVKQSRSTVEKNMDKYLNKYGK